MQTFSNWHTLFSDSQTGFEELL